MQLSSGTQIPDGLLAAMTLRNENSRLGVPSQNHALHQGFDASKSKTAMGLQTPDSKTRIESRCTGKERDAESGLDYFGARYYASNMGRWMSPDWASNPQAVPYSSLANPQSLNLYGYVGNNPLSKTDADGHCWPICDFVVPLENYITSHPAVAAKVDHVIQKGQQFAAAHPRTMKAAKGVGMVAVGAVAVGVAAVSAPEIAAGLTIGAAVQTVGTIFAVQGGVATAVMGTTNIVGAATNTDVSSAEKPMEAMGNPAGQITTAITGSFDSGAKAAAIGGAVVTGANITDLAEGSASLRATKAALAGKDGVDAYSAATEKEHEKKE